MLTILRNLIPPWAWAAALAAAVATLYGWHAYTVHSARTEGRAEVRAEWNAAELTRAGIAQQAAEATKAKEATHARELAKQRAQRTLSAAVAASAVNAARTELDRLRSDIATGAGGCAVPSDPAAGLGIDDGPTRAGELLSACAGELASLAADADRLAGQVSGLQGYVGATRD